MPVINFSYCDLCALVGRDVSRHVLRERLPLIGADPKSIPDDSDELSIEFFPDRPDLYSVEGIARALRAFLGFEPGLRTYDVGTSDVDLVIDESVNDVRPYIWSALVEDNEVDDALIRSMMDLQEKLHLTLGRNRRKVAIGLHDFRAVKPPFTYRAVAPDGISFVPLQGDRKMTLAEILREHEKGRTYASILDGKSRYPIITDRNGDVLSFPPIINGVATAVTEDTKDIFIDCTGTDMNAVTHAVNIVATALAERGGMIKTVQQHRLEGTMPAPDLTPRDMDLDTHYVNGWTGRHLDARETSECLKRMGYGAAYEGSIVQVKVPAYRADILHPIDLVEDVAVGYGYERFGGTLPKRATFGLEEPTIAFGNALRHILIGLGYFEVVTLSLSNARDQYLAFGITEDHATHVKNPVSEDHTLVRTSLIPSLMTILRKNKHRELPQRVFEVGDVVIDGMNRRRLAGASTHAKAGFTEAKSVVQSIASGLGARMSVEAEDVPGFVPGRAAAIMFGETRVGMFGEVSPRTLRSFDLGYPTVALEIDLDVVLELQSSVRC